MSRSLVSPRYSEAGLANRDIFLGERNAVLAYCEDEGFEEFYLRLFRSISAELKIIDVFCLGGKSEVFKKMREPISDNKRRIFLVDKDFDDILGTIKREKGLVYLGRYSIENYFITESLFVDFILDRCRKRRRAEVAAILDFGILLSSSIGWYREICRRFVVIQKFKLRMQSTKIESADIFMSSGEPNTTWWSDYLLAFRDHVHQEQHWLLNDDLLEEELAKAFQPIEQLKDVADQSEFAHLPGKHLVDMILMACHFRFGTGDARTVRYQFLMSSVNRVDSSDFAGLTNKIAALLA